MSIDNECMQCGACCATYRVSFYSGECDDMPGGTVPSSLTEKISFHLCAMRGTNSSSVRCIALLGDIGRSVVCTIYDRRSTTCREFSRTGENGARNESCDKARQVWKMPPLTIAEPNSTDTSR